MSWLTMISWWTIMWLMIAAVIFICACGDPSGSGLLSWLSRLVWGSFWTWVTIAEKILPGFVIRGAMWVWDYIMNKPNPLFQLVYLIIVYGGYGCFLVLGLEHLPARSVHRSTHAPVMLMCLASFVAACWRQPGLITADNVQAMCGMYPYDMVSFKPNVTCRTCKFVKPARSKHCAVCDRCVARFDHHCIWINNCVGAYNYKYFLYFLAQHVFFLAYASYLLGLVLHKIVVEKKLLEARYFDLEKQALVPTTYMWVVQYLAYYHGVLWCLFILAFVMLWMILFFLVQHMWLMVHNVTTNERAKRKQARAEQWEREELAQQQAEHAAQVANAAEAPAAPAGSTTSPSPSAATASDASDAAKSSAAATSEGDSSAAASSSKAKAKPPPARKRKPPASAAPEVEDTTGDTNAEGVRIRAAEEIEENVYDRGYAENIREVVLGGTAAMAVITYPPKQPYHSRRADGHSHSHRHDHSAGHSHASSADPPRRRRR